MINWKKFNDKFEYIEGSVIDSETFTPHKHFRMKTEGHETKEEIVKQFSELLDEMFKVKK